MTPLVPAYWPPPDPRWWSLIRSLPRGSVVIANPANGFGVDDDDWRAHIGRLQALGLLVVGYVATDQMRRAPEAIVAESAKFKVHYGVDGVFHDEIAVAPVASFKKLHGYARACRKVDGKNAGLSIFNPGAPIIGLPYSLPGSIWCIREGTTMPGTDGLTVSNAAVLLHDMGDDAEWARDFLGTDGWDYGWAAREGWTGDHL